MNAAATAAVASARQYVAARAAMRSDPGRMHRQVTTPEGVALHFRIASRGARAGALMLDLVIIFVSLVALILGALALGIGFSSLDFDTPPPALEALVVAAIIALFLVRHFYFLFFELGPRGATPGKRLAGIRVAARPQASGAGGRLTAEAVIARNLTRDIEVFMPAFYLLGGGYGDGVLGLAAGVWLGLFALFPFFNRDALRAGDLVAGTWVIEAERAKLARALSVDAPPLSEYRFGTAELSIYGEHELQVLEGVLRTGNQETVREVAATICRKIGWQPGAGDSQAFLEAFYAALRAHLERGLRFGRRKQDKFS